MKRFLIIVLSVIAFLLVFNVGLDFFISYHLRKSPDRRYASWSNIIYKELNADMVIMGSSRGWVHYSPAILDSILHVNSYNLGFDGSGLNRQIAKYNVYAHYQQVKPKYIIVNIDYFSAEEWSYGYEREQFFPFMREPYFREQIKQVEPFTWQELYLPIYRYTTYKGLYDVLFEKPIDANTYKGYIGHDKSWDGTAFNELKSFRFVVDERVMQMFRDFLTARKQEGQQVIFCISPIYIGFTDKVENVQDFYDCYTALAEEYGIPLLDYNYSDISKDTAFFYNASHLNRQGAELFSMQLAKDLDSILVR